MNVFDMGFKDVPEGRCAMAVMGQEGDVKTSWDPNVPAEVDAARAQFEALTANKRYSAFRLDEHDERGVRMSAFDPTARRIVFVPPMQGG